MQNWVDLYKELAAAINEKIPEVKWVDLWHNQVNFLETEHPFPTPATFLSFRARNLNDKGLKVQTAEIQVEIYFFYETFSDTYHGAFNQEDALEFLNIMEKHYALFHGSSGNNYSEMRRVDFHPVDTGNAGNLYRIVFECLMSDYAAMKIYDDVNISGIEIERGEIDAEPEDFRNGYFIPG